MSAQNFDVSAYIDQARDIHCSEFTYDYLPMGSPVIMTARHETVMCQGLAAAWPLGKTLRSMMDDRLAEVVEAPEVREHVEQTWKRSGVKTIQVTLGGIEIDPCGWTAIVKDLGWYLHADAVSKILKICRTSDELMEASDSGILGVLLGTQDAGWCDHRFERLDFLHQAGLRVLQLTYNGRNVFGDGCSEPANAGLSRLGRSLIQRANERNIIVDVSHCGDRTSLEAVQASSKPVAVTHSACKALHDHPRAKNDELLAALRDNDGFFGVVALPSFLRSDEAHASVRDIARHVAHAASIVGIERVGIATDWGAYTPDVPPQLYPATRQAFIDAGFEPSKVPTMGHFPLGFRDWSDWPNITAALLEAGYRREQVRGLVGRNWLDFMKRSGL